MRPLMPPNQQPQPPDGESAHNTTIFNGSTIIDVLTENMNDTYESTNGMYTPPPPNDYSFLDNYYAGAEEGATGDYPMKDSSWMYDFNLNTEEVYCHVNFLLHPHPTTGECTDFKTKPWTKLINILLFVKKISM